MEFVQVVLEVQESKMIKETIKDLFKQIFSNKKKLIVLGLLTSFVILSAVFCVWQGFYVAIPFVIFSFLFALSVSFLGNRKLKAIVPKWSKIIAVLIAIYTGYFLIGVLVVNAPSIETYSNSYAGKEISTAGAIKRSLSGYEYLGRVDYKRIYISEAIEKYTGKHALGEISSNVSDDSVIDSLKTPNKDKVIIFFKNNCPYCAGGFSGVLKTYSELQEDEKRNVVFVNVETEFGAKVAQEFELKTASTAIRVSEGGNEVIKVSFSTEDKTPNTDAIKMIFSPLYT